MYFVFLEVRADNEHEEQIAIEARIGGCYHVADIVMLFSEQQAIFSGSSETWDAMTTNGLSRQPWRIQILSSLLENYGHVVGP